MIKKVTVTNPRGEVLTMELTNPSASGFVVRRIDGLGPPKSVINMGESLYEDGSYFNSARLTNRNLIFDLEFYDSVTETIEAIRNKTYRFFPMKTPLTIEVETDTRVGVTSGYVESNEPNIFSKEESTQISIVCPSAYFLGKDAILTTFSGIQNGFEFPWENPSLTLKLIEFGQVFISTNANVFYTGDADTGVTIYINFIGAVNNLTIHNVNTGENMAINSTKLIALTGANFQAGDFVIISTVKGNKFITLIRGSSVYNILNAVDILADWFQISRGDNVFTYTAASGVNNVQFSIEHHLVYEGL